MPTAWQAAPRLRRLAAIGVAVAIAAVVTRHADLLLLGAPALAALAAARRGARPAAVDAGVTAAPSRCFEGEEVDHGLVVAPIKPLEVFGNAPAKSPDPYGDLQQRE